MRAASLGVGVFCVALLLSAPALAVTVDKAQMVNGAIVVKGDALPEAEIRWQGVPVTEADQSGYFEFTTVIPPERDCIGKVREEDEDEPQAEVEIKNCKMTIRSFYTGTLAENTVDPGVFDYVRSECELGDFAVSGTWFASLAPPAPDFRIQSVGVVIDGQTGIQSWVLQGRNDGPAPVVIRVLANCADVVLSDQK